ncbi:MAG: glycosyltransferase [Hyphomicrobiaceae bacterium]
MRAADPTDDPDRVDRTQVAVVTFSRIARDTRVLRQCQLIASLGYDPLVIAYGEAGDRTPFRVASWPLPRPSVAHRLNTVVRQLPAHAGRLAARAGFWMAPAHRFALAQLEKARPTLVVANDWPALVVAAAYKARCSAGRGGPGAAPVKIHYDTHEFATLEFDDSPLWRVLYKPMVVRLERAAIASADSISTVGPGIAEAINALSPESVARFKTAARRAAGALCWDRERIVLRDCLLAHLNDAEHSAKGEA